MNVVYLKIFPNGKFYIGVSNDFERRMSRHIYESKNPKYPINHAIAKYPDHETKIIFESENYEEVLKKEKEFIQEYKLLGRELYNLTDGGEGFSGFKKTEKHKRKISTANKGKKKKKHSKEAIERRMATTKIAAEKSLEEKTFTRSNFKGMCKRFNWDFEKYSEEHKGWHKYPDGRKKRLYKYTKLTEGLKKIKTEEKNALEKIKVNSYVRGDFKKICKTHNWKFEDFSEEFCELYVSPKGDKKKKYKYKRI